MASSILDILNNYANNKSNNGELGNERDLSVKRSGGSGITGISDHGIYSTSPSSTTTTNSTSSHFTKPTKTILINKKHSYDHHVTTDLFKTMYRSGGGNGRHGQQTRLQRPIVPSTPPPSSLPPQSHSPNSTNLNQSSSVTPSTSGNNKIRVRLLVFAEDPSATRTNIFDSAKHQQQQQYQQQPPVSIGSRKLSRSSMHGKLNGLSIGENTSCGSFDASKSLLTGKYHHHHKVEASSSYTASATKLTDSTSSLNRANSASSSTNNNNTKLNNEMILRMVFGSYPMHVSDRTAIKVHSLTNSNKAMISNVFNYYKNSPNKTQCYCKPIQANPTTTASTSTMISSQPVAVNEVDGRPAQSNSPSQLASSSVSSSSAAIRSSTAIPIKQASSSSSSVHISVSNHGSLTSSLLSNHHHTSSVSTAAVKTSHPNPSSQHKLNSDYSSTSSSFNSNSNLCVNMNASKSGVPSHLHNTSCNNNNITNLLGSSVPTSSGSYMGVYKRFMRSISNSLISSNSNLTTVDTVGTNGLAGSCGSSTGRLTADVNSDSEFKNSSSTNFDGQAVNTDSDRLRSAHNNNTVNSERASLSGMSNSGHPSYLCEKCLENNLYPKYKIGVAIIFSVPQSKTNDPTGTPTTKQGSEMMMSQSPVSNADHVASGAYLSRSTSIRADETASPTPLPFDPLLLFPATTSSSSNSPTSPPNSPHSQSSLLLNNTTTGSECKPNSSRSATDRSDEFYEFLFTHLPIIEYQFKELREKVINHLPNYFNNPRFNQFSHRHSITSQTSNGSGLALNGHIYKLPPSSTHSSISNLLSAAASASPTSSNGMSFTRQLLHEQELFEKRFNLLYYAPRLSCPAWLSLMSQTKTKQNGRQVAESNNSNIASTLIKDLLYLSRPQVNIEPRSPSSSFIGPRTPTESSGYLSSIYQKFFKNSASSSSISSSPEPLHFLSTLLSTILKYHLSWVYTVLPSNEIGIDDSTNLSSHRLRKQRAYWTRLLEKTNPYNPLWAQLGDLHGAVNQPLRLVRTVVVGQNRQMVEKILFLLSYFIRCGNSSYFDLVQESFDFDQLVESIGEEMSLSSLNQSGSSETNNERVVKAAPAATQREVDIITGESKPDDPFAQLSIILGRSSSINQDLFAQQQTKENQSTDGASILAANTTTVSVKTTTSESSSSNLSSPYNTLPGKKKRLLSSSSNGANCSARELPLIGCKLKPNHQKSTRMQDNFGYSLLASYCDEFCFEFVLHGTSDRSFLNDLHQRVCFSKNNSILDSQIDESVYIVVDVDQFEIKVFSSDMTKPVVKEKPVSLVEEMLTSLLDMTKLFQNSDFVLLHLEDKLQEFYTKSLTLSQLKSQSVEMDDQTLMHLMDFNDPSDLDFLKRILSTVTLPNMTVLVAD